MSKLRGTLILYTPTNIFLLTWQSAAASILSPGAARPLLDLDRAAAAAVGPGAGDDGAEEGGAGRHAAAAGARNSSRGGAEGTGGRHQLTATCTQQYDLCRHATTITARKFFTLFVRRAVHISGLRHRITRRLESSYLYLSPGWRGEAALRHQLSLYTLSWSRWQRGSGGRTANLSPDLRLLPSTRTYLHIHTPTR